MKQKWYDIKWVVFLIHTTAWILLFLLPFLIHTSYDNHRNRNPSPDYHALYMYVSSAICWIGIFYLNAYVLIPRFIYKKKIGQYLMLQVVVLAVRFGLDFMFFYMFMTGLTYHFINFISFNIFPYLFILASSTAYQMIRYKMESDQLIKEKENENLKTELSFLRSQVSPHFMFNVLNNMVAMARKHSGELEPSLIKLSSLMRYMLYETDEEKVPLEKEIEYLQSYIDLQQQRFGKNVKLNVSLDSIDKAYEIEPMLLIPFVENAFKHGTGMVEDATIDVELKAEKNILHFAVRNRFNEEIEEVRDKTSGIGLTNVKRRLMLLYGKNQNCWITKKDNWFLVSLQLNLH